MTSKKYQANETRLFACNCLSANRSAVPVDVIGFDVFGR
jgi:hypothetical protein